MAYDIKEKFSGLKRPVKAEEENKPPEENRPPEENKPPEEE